MEKSNKEKKLQLEKIVENGKIPSKLRNSLKVALEDFKRISYIGNKSRLDLSYDGADIELRVNMHSHPFSSAEIFNLGPIDNSRYEASYTSFDRKKTKETFFNEKFRKHENGSKIIKGFKERLIEKSDYYSKEADYNGSSGGVPHLTGITNSIKESSNALSYFSNVFYEKLGGLHKVG